MSVDRESLEILHRRAVILLTVLAAFAALKVGASVLMPFAAALFLIALAWPLKEWLNRRLPASLSYFGSFLALILVLGFFVGSIWLSAREFFETAPQYKPEIQRFLRKIRYILALNGVKTSPNVELEDIKDGIGLVVQNVNEAVLFLGIIIGYVLLALPEITTWKSKLRLCFGRDQHETILSTASELGASFKTYLVAMLIAGVISAAATWAAAFALGLDFAMTWGVLAFLMNFIPTIGALMMIIPPTLFAFLQFDGLGMPLLVLASFTVIQMFVGLVVDTRLQGGMLSISPLVVLFSLALWGFLWGLPGALLATPLTHATIIVCNHYERTRWVACLLSYGRPAASRT